MHALGLSDCRRVDLFPDSLLPESSLLESQEEVTMRPHFVLEYADMADLASATTTSPVFVTPTVAKSVPTSPPPHLAAASSSRRSKRRRRARLEGTRPFNDNESNEEDERSKVNVWCRHLRLDEPHVALLWIVALALLLLLLLIALLALSVALWPKGEDDDHVGNTAGFLRAAATMVDMRNHSVPPCVDMWKHACGGWLSRRLMPSWSSSWSVLESLRTSRLRTDARLVAAIANEPSDYNSLEWKLKNFFMSCMSLSFVESDREKPLMKLVNSLGGWQVLRSFNLYSWDSHRVLRELHADHHVHAFFRVDVVSDPRESKSAIFRITPDGLGLPDRNFYHRLPDDPVVKAYLTLMKDTAQLMGASSPQAHKFSVDTFNFEKRLAEIIPDEHTSETAAMDMANEHHFMSLRQLHRVSINVPWLEILKACYSEAAISETTEVSVASPQHAADIAVVLSTTDRGSLNNYLMWHLVKSYLPFLSKTYVEVVDNFEKALTGSHEAKPRWHFCISKTRDVFAPLLDVLRHDDESNKESKENNEDNKSTETARGLFMGLKHVVAKSLSVALDTDLIARTRSLALLQSMRVHLGTADLPFVRDRRFLSNLFNSMMVQKTDFFQNVLYSRIFRRKREELFLVTPSETAKYLPLLTSQEVEYEMTSNLVVVPELFLHQPFFHMDFPRSVNIAGLGLRILQAVMKGVLVQQSRQNDSMTSSSLLSSFSSYASCLSSEFAFLAVDTSSFLSKCESSTALTVLAMHQAMLAVDDKVAVAGLDAAIPTLTSLDKKQVLLLAFAQNLCSKESFRERDLRRTANKELLNEERLKAVISQMAKPLQCTQHTPLTNCQVPF